MRKRRLLLAATALSAACGKGKGEERQPLPGNPKGSVYDAAIAPPETLPLPGNPKGALYDAGVDLQPPDAATADAVGAPRDARRAPNDAGPVIRPLPGNPKGSRYDGGLQPIKPNNPDD